MEGRNRTRKKIEHWSTVFFAAPSGPSHFSLQVPFLLSLVIFSYLAQLLEEVKRLGVGRLFVEWGDLPAHRG